jgi:chemotaxis methyl-accepting protein methylase
MNEPLLCFAALALARLSTGRQGIMMSDAAFRKLLDSMHLSWSGYRRVRKGVKRHLSHRMMEIGVASVGDYIQLLKSDPAESREAVRLLAVSISRFFRDRRMWEALEEMIPQLGWEGMASGTAWCAGCASGEEAYSLKILWEELRTATRLPPLHIVATDVNGALLERARQGIYSASSLKEVDAPVRERFFRKLEGRLVVRQDLIQGIHWMVHDFTAEPPPCRPCHLILLRNNLLTYYDPSVFIPALARIVGALLKGGLLIVGNNEQLPVHDFPLESTKAYRAILRKVH